MGRYFVGMKKKKKFKPHPKKQDSGTSLEFYDFKKVLRSPYVLFIWHSSTLQITREDANYFN